VQKRVVFAQSNNPAGNQILVHDRAYDGTLTFVEAVDTGGLGGIHEASPNDPLASQGCVKVM
jgi:hypothetical protein